MSEVGLPESVRLVSGYGRNFWLYATGQAISVIGDRIALITLVFLVIHLSHASAPALALLYICRAAPTLLLGFFVGAIADHFDRRRLMIACDAGRAILLLAIPTLSQLNLGTLYPMVAVLFALTLLFSVASSASIPDVVPEFKMMGANGILNGIRTGADIAYAAGGIMIFVLKYQLPFYIDAATFAFSGLTITLMVIPGHPQVRRFDFIDVLKRIRGGADYIGNHPFLRKSILAFALAPLASGASYVIGPLFATNVLSHSPGLFGPLRSSAFRFSVLEVCLGAGGVVGSLLVARLGFNRGALFGAGMLGSGISDALIATTTNIYVVALFIALSGVFFSIFAVSGVTMVQTLTPSEARGRVVAARMVTINGATLVGSALAGSALLIIPVRALWVIEGLVMVAASLTVWLQAAVRNQE
ncbi:MAG: MFS transporter [Chloroflexota bacterium]